MVPESPNEMEEDKRRKSRSQTKEKTTATGHFRRVNLVQVAVHLITQISAKSIDFIPISS